jgi:leucyl aminopeptidase
MKYSTSTGNLTTLATDSLVTTLANARRVAKSLRVDDYFAAATRDFEDKVGKTLAVSMPAGKKVKRLLILGTSKGTLSSADFRKVFQAAASQLKTAAVRAATLDLDAFNVADHDSYQKARIALALLSAGLYRFAARKKPDDNPATELARIAVRVDGRSRAAVARAVRHAGALDAGMAFARDLGNQPPNICNPTYLARQARTLGRAERTTCKVLDERQIDALGMGAFMSVTRGSDTPGKLIIVEYRGGKRGAAPITLIGKGITFDTGGISLKPGPAMDEMKFDMCGAAAVLGCAKAVIEAKLPVNLIAMVAAAENMPSGHASRPGDVVETLSGQTVEILNTDAEGRLVLCDAITYARRYKPRVVIDVATLTGACIIALGSHASGLFANDDGLANDLLGAGEFIGDRAWRLPVWEDYQSSLKSNFADMANIGGREAGAITAACFLARFARDLRWAHLDVAGSAFSGGPAKGASGRPVPLLFQYVLNQV